MFRARRAALVVLVTIVVAIAAALNIRSPDTLDWDTPAQPLTAIGAVL